MYNIDGKRSCFVRVLGFWDANETLSFQQVKNVKRKHRKACVLLIEGNTNDKKKG